MPDSLSILCLEHRLMTLGCPADAVRRKVRELADHHEDLKLAALEEGCSEREAEARADRQLGNPEELAEHLSLVLRKSSWWGRHPVIGFCLLPPLAFLVAWAALEASLVGFAAGGLRLLYGRSFGLADLAAAVNFDPEGFALYFGIAKGMNYVATAAAALGFCKLASRSGAGMKWVFAVCAVVALQGLLYQYEVASHRVTFGYGWPPNWGCGVFPLLVGGFMWARQRRREHGSAAALAAFCPAAGTLPCPVPVLSRGNFPSPTRVGVFLATVALGVAIGFGISARGSAAARLRNLAANTWPAERAAAVAQLRSRQTTASVYETLIPLQAFVNVALDESVAASREVKDNSLSSLPSGVHTFGGVPFEVSGRVQLMGRGFREGGRVYPSKARNIPIQRRLRQLHLLHGACFIDAESANAGTQIGRVMLHYADGSQVELPVLAGAHVLDWWGPVFRTEAEFPSRPTSAASELAWVGINPAIQRKQPENSLRLFKTTFDNPHPESIVVSADYVSTMTTAAPFFVGLTVE